MRPSPVRAWWLAIRPKTLTISVIPVVVGTSLALAETGRLSWSIMLAALLASMLIQVGTNLHNDAGDFTRGADAPTRLGPPRVTSQGWLTAEQVNRGAVLSFTTAALIGSYLIWLGGWPILVT